LEDVSCYPALFAELLSRGWSEADCRALAGGNILRVMRAAGSHAVTAGGIRPGHHGESPAQTRNRPPNRP
jgi:Membrane dipeptidase (Peptidase family M19)